MKSGAYTDIRPIFSQILATFDLLHPRDSGDVFEIRILGAAQGGVCSGFFRAIDNERTAKGLAGWLSTNRVTGVYSTLNPVLPNLFFTTKHPGKLNWCVHETIKDHQITRRTNILIDLDPIRVPKKIPSTDGEHAAALARADEVRAFLSTLGFSPPLIVGDTGNGAAIVYRVNLPNSAAATRRIREFLEALGRKFTDNVVEVDRGTYNASRITKVYGTMARKGDDTPERPHRRTEIRS